MSDTHGILLVWGLLVLDLIAAARVGRVSSCDVDRKVNRVHASTSELLFIPQGLEYSGAGSEKNVRSAVSSQDDGQEAVPEVHRQAHRQSPFESQYQQERRRPGK